MKQKKIMKNLLEKKMKRMKIFQYMMQMTENQDKV